MGIGIQIKGASGNVNTLINEYKPKVLFICDVKNWAWFFKSMELKRWLNNEFDIDIACVLSGDKIDPKKYDIYFTFGFSYIDLPILKDVPKSKKITGVTAHRSLNILKSKMNMADNVHANSKLLYNELKKIHNSVYYLPNGVNEKLFTEQKIPNKRENIIIGHVGKLSSLKGQREFIEPAIRKAKCLYHPNYKDHTEMLPHEAMPGSFYKQMDALIIASTEDGTPNSALEAAACGRTIISNAIGNMPEFIVNGYNGFIVPKNIDSYVEKILYLRDNRNELIKMGKRARKTIEEGWTWRIQAENYRKMLRNILVSTSVFDVSILTIKKEELRIKELKAKELRIKELKDKENKIKEDKIKKSKELKTKEENVKDDKISLIRELKTKENKATEALTKELKIKEALAKELKIKELEAIENKATEAIEVKAKELKAKELKAIEAKIKELKVIEAKIKESKDIEAKKAKIKELKAIEAKIKELEAKEAKIKELKTKELKAKEIKELKDIEIKVKELKAKEAKVKEIKELKDIEIKVKELKAKEAKVKELRAKEDKAIEAKESRAKENKIKELKAKELRAKEDKVKSKKPSILLLVDVVGWAWDEKARNLKKWLSDEFNIQIRYFQSSSYNKFDKNENFHLYFSFECGSAHYVENIKTKLKITGATSHTFTNLKGQWKKSLETSPILHANSKLLQKELQTMFPKKIVYYIPNGVDEEKFSLVERNINKPFTACYVGKNTKRKGYNDFIVPACKKAGVVLKSQTCRFNSLDVIKHDDMPNFYNDIDVVLVASDMDGTPNALLEAASKGRTFIGNAIGNVPEFINEGVNGFMVERKINEYVEKLKWLKDNRQECKDMGLAARKTIEEGWTWKIQAENYRKMFREALGK